MLNVARNSVEHRLDRLDPDFQARPAKARQLATNRDHHFEIVARQGNRWIILHVVQSRAEAIELATRAWSNQKYDAVRATSETYRSDTREFQSVEIFNRGTLRKRRKVSRRGHVIPCIGYQDLYNRDGRQTIWSVLHRTLTDWKITPTELLHSMKHYLKLYNTGMLIRDAVQRTAVSIESETEDESIQVRVRRLDKIVDAAVNNLKSYRGDVPKLYPGGMGKVAGKLEGRKDREFVLAMALTDYLQDAVSIEDKLGRVAAFLGQNRPVWVMTVLDQFLSELLLNPKLMPLLINGEGRHVDYLHAIVLLNMGRLDDFAAAEKRSIETFGSEKFSLHEELLRINDFIKGNKLPETCMVLEKFLKAETRSTTKIVKGSIMEQLTELDRFIGLIEIYSIPPGLREAINDNIKERASRLINSQSVAELLSELDSPIDRVYKLLDLHDVTIGEGNQRTIANFIMPILSRPEHEAQMMGLGGQRLEVMKTLAQLQCRVISMNISELQRRKISERLDYFCKTILERSQIIEKINQMSVSDSVKVTKVLGLLADGFLTEGDCRARAEDYTRSFLRRPDFMKKLIAESEGTQKTKALLEFRRLMTRAGLGKAAKTTENRSSEVVTDTQMQLRSKSTSLARHAPQETVLTQ